MKDETFQRDVFVTDEGNRYFGRNKDGLESPSPVKNLVTERLAHHLAPYQRAQVLEVGCSSGGNLAALSSRASVDCFGVDPSSDAVRVGKQTYPNIDLYVGSADTLPFSDGSMDMVWFGFCLYLVDRALLHRVISEADRIVKDGGIVAIHDFDPVVPCVRPYKHVQGVNSYKMNYSALFLSDPAYSLVEKVAFTHDNIQWTSDVQERLALWICRKNLLLGYQVL
ncbi:MAG: class I SAM-dependent methyltransferase [Pseudomonadota bacterium]|nr:class I SAM-dependent methyltransferase [Pseudomonadota bacterium]